MKMGFWTAVMGVAVGASPVFAQFASETPNYNRQVRNLGMGNVGVALRGSHGSSPFYNPAGLNDLEEAEFRFFSPTMEISSNAFGVYGDVRDLNDDIDAAATDSEKTQVYDQFIQDNTGEFRQFRLAIDLASFAKKNFAAGIGFDSRSGTAVRNQAFPTFQLRTVSDVAFHVAGAHDFWEKLVQVGVTIRPTIRMSLDEIDQNVTYSDFVGDRFGDQADNIKEPKFGLGIDVGLKSNLGFPGFKDSSTWEYLKPQVGVTWQDLGSPTFDAAPGNEQSINVGAAVHPDFWKLKNTVALDVRELNQEREFLSKLHFGLEAQFPVILSARVGLSQGYFTGGLSADFAVVRIDAAMYSEEVGTMTRQEADRRYAMTLVFKI